MTTGLNVTVVGGAGMMGRLIGGEMALSGHSVILFDLNPDKLAAARENLFEQMASLVTEGLLTPEDVEDCRLRVTCSNELPEAVAVADFVIESVVEREAIKKSVFRDITRHCPARTICATNSMTMSVSVISEDAIDKTRIMGVRFLYPVLLVPDVEITAGMETDPACVEQAKSMLMSMDKQPFYKAPGSGNHLKLLAQNYKRRQREGAETRRRRVGISGGIHGQNALADPGSYYRGDGQPLRTNHFPSVRPPASAPAVPSAPQLEDLHLGVVQQGMAQLSVHGTPAEPMWEDAGPIPREMSEDDGSKCAICLDGPKNGLFFPCGHLCACMPCSEALQATAPHKCPICRAQITKVVRVFVS